MNEREIRFCKHHGEVVFVKEKRGYFRCTKCRSEAVSKRRRDLKLKAVEYKGGKCSKCGYSKCVAALEFHHTTEDKDYSLGDKGNTRSWDKVTQELDKCILVCTNCHREIHSGM